jgi:hypothetical protein
MAKIFDAEENLVYLGAVAKGKRHGKGIFFRFF